MWIVIFFLFSCQLNLKPSSNFSPIEAKVVSIVDGDTIVVKPLDSDTNYVVRFLYIDAPERKENSRFEKFVDNLYKKEIYLKRDEIINLGLLSLSNLRSVLKSNDNITLYSDNFDVYGRMLAIVYKGGTNINLYQVESGFAFCYFYNKKADKKFLRAEKEARKKKLGIWKYLK